MIGLAPTMEQWDLNRGDIEVCSFNLSNHSANMRFLCTSHSAFAYSCNTSRVLDAKAPKYTFEVISQGVFVLISPIYDLGNGSGGTETGAASQSTPHPTSAWNL